MKRILGFLVMALIMSILFIGFLKVTISDKLSSDSDVQSENVER